MSKKLAGTLFVYNGNKFDYCYKEAIICLLEFCDHVIVVAGGDDNTLEEVLRIAFISDKNVNVIPVSKKEWDEQKGKEKLNYFTNIAIKSSEKIGFDYQFNLQADEVVHEKSYASIRKAVESGQEGFMCNRINLWGTPYMQLNVTPDRLPCSTNIVRLAKVKYRSYGDAESLAVDNVSNDFLNQIDIWHYGFVRDKKIMKQKVIHIQEEVFLVDHDKKLDGIEYFDSERWFTKKDLKPIAYPHPKIMKEWAAERYRINNFEI